LIDWGERPTAQVQANKQLQREEAVSAKETRQEACLTYHWRKLGGGANQEPNDALKNGT